MLMHVCVLSPKTRWNIYWILVVFHIQFWTNWTNGNAKIFRHDQQWTAILQRWTAILTDRTMTDMRIPQWAFHYRSHNKVTSAGGLIRIGGCEGFYMQLHALCKPVNTLNAIFFCNMFILWHFLTVWQQDWWKILRNYIFLARILSVRLC